MELSGRVEQGNLAHWGNSGRRVKSSVNHKVYTLFVVIVVSMNLSFSSSKFV